MVVESQQIFKEFKEHSVAEFFKKNRQMLGYSGPIKSLTTAVHELVTNGLDACEEAGVTPDIYVKLEKLGPDHMRFIVEDNGPGIPKKFVGKALGTMLAGTKFHRFRQARGQQGIGGAGVVMFG
ncbi:ATP-binding protein, partial [archaeon]|nr:ATP-binding protein [archaeon]